MGRWYLVQDIPFRVRVEAEAESNDEAAELLWGVDYQNTLSSLERDLVRKFASPHDDQLVKIDQQQNVHVVHSSAWR